MYLTAFQSGASTMFAISVNFAGIFLAMLLVSSSQQLPTAPENCGKDPGCCLPPSNVPQYIVLPQYNPTSGSIFCNVPSVTFFTNTFLDAVYKNDILREVFDVSQTTPREYSEFARRYTEKVLRQVGVPPELAAQLSEFAFRAIEPNFEVLTMPIVARAYANMIANVLFVDGYLESHNPKELALAFAKTMEDSAKVTMNSNPFSKLQALCDGFVNFLFSIDSYTKEKAILATFYVGNEWFVAAVNYRRRL